MSEGIRLQTRNPGQIIQPSESEKPEGEQIEGSKEVSAEVEVVGSTPSEASTQPERSIQVLRPPSPGHFIAAKYATFEERHKEIEPISVSLTYTCMTNEGIRTQVIFVFTCHNEAERTQ